MRELRIFSTLNASLPHFCAKIRTNFLPPVRKSALTPVRGARKASWNTGWDAGILLLIVLVATVLIGALAILGLDRAMRVRALAETRTAATSQAAILAAGLESELNKFSLVPRVLAVDPEARRLARRGTQSAKRAQSPPRRAGTANRCSGDSI